MSLKVINDSGNGYRVVDFLLVVSVNHICLFCIVSDILCLLTVCHTQLFIKLNDMVYDNSNYRTPVRCGEYISAAMCYNFRDIDISSRCDLEFQRLEEADDWRKFHPRTLRTYLFMRKSVSVPAVTEQLGFTVWPVNMRRKLRRGAQDSCDSYITSRKLSRAAAHQTHWVFFFVAGVVWHCPRSRGTSRTRRRFAQS